MKIQKNLKKKYFTVYKFFKISKYDQVSMATFLFAFLSCLQWNKMF